MLYTAVVFPTIFCSLVILTIFCTLAQSARIYRRKLQRERPQRPLRPRLAAGAAAQRALDLDHLRLHLARRGPEPQRLRDDVRQHLRRPSRGAHRGSPRISHTNSPYNRYSRKWGPPVGVGRGSFRMLQGRLLLVMAMRRNHTCRRTFPSRSPTSAARAPVAASSAAAAAGARCEPRESRASFAS